MKYYFNIDEKSLFHGVKNDYSKGQSATVHTPLNQSKDKQKWHNDIYAFLAAYKSEDISKLPDRLKDLCQRQTTSKASTSLVGLYVFSKFSLDGVPFDTNASFAMYVKEETSENIAKRDGRISANTHLGRQKLHYPTNLDYTTDGYNINNRIVLNKILEVNGGFAYVVNGFDYDTDTEILNFKTTMIGPKDVLLSNVFKRKKGVGVKLLVDGISIEYSSIVPAANKILTQKEKKSFISSLERIQESSRSNGILGEKYVFENIENIIGEKIQNKIHISQKYPLSPYDIECNMEDGKKMYIEVKSTVSEKKYFYMSRGERYFMDRYAPNYLLILVTNVKTNHKRAFKYLRKEIMNSNIMEQENQSIKFIVRT